MDRDRLTRTYDECPDLHAYFLHQILDPEPVVWCVDLR